MNSQMADDKMERRKWTRSELIIAFNLYCRIPFGRIHNKNPEIIVLAKALGRTPSALSWKLANFARFDPVLKKRDISGAKHGGKLEEEIWDEFNRNWEKLSFESERLRLELEGSSLPAEQKALFPEGIQREAIVQVRVNQGFFRSAILAAYDSKCCITGLSVAELLCASHIVPWSIDSKNRTNPQNGLCLNAIHDRAFDRGLLTITSDYRVRVSPLLTKVKDDGVKSLILPYDGRSMNLPARFQPDASFLEYHNKHIYHER
jgi:putative restriction endonuclease